MLLEDYTIEEIENMNMHVLERLTKIKSEHNKKHNALLEAKELEKQLGR